MARWSDEPRALLRLAFPVIVGQLSQVGMGFTDTVMAGRLSAADLAAVALGSTLWLVPFLGMLGVLMALSPAVAQLFGAGREEEIGAVGQQGLWLALLLGILTVPVTAAMALVPPWLGMEAPVVDITGEYVNAVAWGMPGAALFLALRFVNEGLGNTRPMMVIQLGGLALNAVLDYLLMFGNHGAPKLGAVGAAWATTSVFWLSAAGMCGYSAWSPRIRGLGLLAQLHRLRPESIAGLVRVGAPISVSLLMEVGMFAGVALMMGSLGTAAMAAHQVAISYAALMFMVPLGFSVAMTIRIGHAIGRGDRLAARLAGDTGIAMAAGFMSLSAMVMWLFPSAIIAIYTSDPVVSRVALGLLSIAAVFQIFDGLQVAGAGALRGLKDTARPMLLLFVAYWMVGLPLAWGLGFGLELGPRGLWTGFVGGLAIASGLLITRFWRLVPN
ncbi:MAG: MATE family efflux transporter [Gammaproteobacteria bacterium]|jgi:MATE family multidrug resistance protein|nr:MATE family efflux transporter [Gammaproteobacteria bacterium]